MTWRKKTILVTGASGVVGRALIDELAGDFDIVCMRNRTPVADVRVSEFVGSFEQPMLGMSLKRLCITGQACRRHCPRSSRDQLEGRPGADPRSEPRRAPRALLQLATVADAPLYFLSTAFVANPPAPNGHSPGAAAYVRSKIDAEQLVRQAPCPHRVIVRPSIVSGTRRAAEWPDFRGFMLCGRHRAGQRRPAHAPKMR
ncbi:SDR family oxidoreductase [Mycobacterium sp. 134]|uniref:SDR family oxidoreductase n=1 Tax=Mycobacterium sp. 134 TaxID=3400425 RepID=UPI003AAD5E23